eukprot:CAMPEP_0197318274 /NCGR_PEP_ID=MMETSP0891-20130614/50270_1 /TAXON_ID=44058 ORGANISM="Aureoumbra lagunensis, Strain CCMP1510" /NCGR_SAMPLE_ID=MMETSP0891 /ASSEMBLY_ACC=CAM_ASM_000534 /LENGTH=56 /DNA_ID=CAMNT_0042808629 /DNA_START=32 /DNA_END=202 /DNA_ORIENTATION=-
MTIVILPLLFVATISTQVIVRSKIQEDDIISTDNDKKGGDQLLIKSNQCNQYLIGN